MRNRLGLHFVARREVQTQPAAKFASMGCGVQRGPKITPVQQPRTISNRKFVTGRQSLGMASQEASALILIED